MKLEKKDGFMLSIHYKLSMLLVVLIVAISAGCGEPGENNVSFSDDSVAGAEEAVTTEDDDAAPKLDFTKSASGETLLDGKVIEKSSSCDGPDGSCLLNAGYTGAVGAWVYGFRSGSSVYPYWVTFENAGGGSWQFYVDQHFIRGDGGKITYFHSTKRHNTAWFSGYHHWLATSVSPYFKIYIKANIPFAADDSYVPTYVHMN